MEIKVGKYNLFFSPEILEILNSFKQRNLQDSEKGGIILGKVFENKTHILRISLPTELDKPSRMNFERHRLSAQIVINYEFINSNKQITYLGEWHTHPENFPTPSSTDKKMINEQFSKNSIHTNFLILLIQGLESLYIGILDSEGVTESSITN